jgi:hypothetical protein
MPAEHVSHARVECSSRFASAEQDKGRSVASIIVAFADQHSALADSTLSSLHAHP